MAIPSLFIDYLVNGAIGGAVLALVAFLLSRFVREILGRALLAAVLIAAGGFYVSFAISAGAGPGWIAIEVVQAGVLAVFAVLGLRKSPYWLAAGWALHPFWDVLMHLWGPGHAFAPEAYATACLTYDWVVALYIVAAYTTAGAFRFARRAARPARPATISA